MGCLDRHKGTRENIWFSCGEHKKMLDAMTVVKETNKSNFIRTAVRCFAETIIEPIAHSDKR